MIRPSWIGCGEMVARMASETKKLIDTSIGQVLAVAGATRMGQDCLSGLAELGERNETSGVEPGPDHL